MPYIRVLTKILCFLALSLACDKPVIIQVENADGDAECVVSPGLLDLGAITVGADSEEIVTVRNTGGGTLTGFLSLADTTGAFEIVSGGGSFQLRKNELRFVLIRFRPDASGTFSCRLLTNTSCRPVVCEGVGKLAATCDLEPDSLVFPSVTVGETALDTFTVRNGGDDALFGNVFLNCDRFEVISGGGPFVLGSDSSFQVAVRFAPGDTLLERCELSLSNDACEPLALVGQGTRALFPDCVTSKTTLDFGTIETGANARDTLRVFNVGEADLAGTVSIANPCAPFTIVSGGGDYTLAPNDSMLVVVSFAPGGTPGTFACELSLGSPFCPEPIGLTGSADDPAVCAIEPEAIDFGDVFVGESETRSFTIRNDGGSMLTGAFDETCDDVSLTAGAGAFALAAGESLAVSVAWTPSAAGALACTLFYAGSGDCGEVVATGNAVLPASCMVSDASVDFGTVAVGSTATRTFTLENAGGASYDGEVGAPCDGFAIESGGGAYTLAPSASRDVTVRFEPDAGGAFVCTLATGCDTPVVLRGEGDPAPVCRVEPDSLDFGSITPGQFVTRSFTIANDGGQTLTGRISIPCRSNFRIEDGEEQEFALGPGESRTVGVRFSPQLEGEKTCTFTFDNALCGTIEATGFGDPEAECLISPTNLSFPNRTIGEDTTLAFVVKNTGGSMLSGTVTAPCDHFAIVAGTESYALAADESDTVEVRFAPAAAGLQQCTIVTGCTQNVDVSGTGKLPPTCSLTVAETDFGLVTIGTSSDLAVQVSNTGAGVLNGALSLSCADYAVVGSSSYSLGTDETASFTVRYTPSDTVQTTCDVATGCDSTITFTGRGERAPVCSLGTTAIDFDSVLVGESAVDTFTITNTGGGTLGGAVTESCADLAITTGAGEYSLGEGETHEVVVTFTPASQGAFACDIATGCADDVAVTGTGYSLVSCSLSTTSLDFGSISTGSTKDLSFTITNTGVETISGSALEFCTGYSIISGSGAFNLTTGQSRTVTVRFAPATSGTFDCSINLGTDCGAVSLTGEAAQGPVCNLSATSRNFGNVAPTKSSDLSFTITNTGGGTLTGSVSISSGGAFFSIVSGGGSYSLGANESRTVTVRFSPGATTCGQQSGTVTTGGSCASVSLSGNARETWNNYVKAILGAGGENCVQCHDGGSIGDFTDIDDVRSKVNLGSPESSPLLTEPAPNGVSHSGGSFSCFTISSGECYKRVLCWIQQGTPQ